MRNRRQVWAGLLTAAALVATGFITPASASADPLVGACYDYPLPLRVPISSAAPAIGCEAPHAVETYKVVSIPESFGTPSKSTISARLRAGKECTTAAMNAYLGLSERVLPTRFLSLAMFPTDPQWAAGERWMRCDVGLQLGASFAPIAGTMAAFVAATPAADLNACTVGTPNPVKNALYTCTPPKRKDWVDNPPRDLNWIKVLEQPVTAPKFPGDARVVGLAVKVCEKQGARFKGKSDLPGWWRINPTKVGWTKGRRLIQCFVPYAQYLEHLAKQKPKPSPTPAPTAAPVPAPTADPAPAPSPTPTA